MKDWYLGGLNTIKKPKNKNLGLLMELSPRIEGSFKLEKEKKEMSKIYL